MTEPENTNVNAARSPFYCLAVPIAPQQGKERAALVRLEELVGRSLWLVKLRWLGAAGLFAAITLARFVLRLPVPAGALYALAACVPLYNALFLALLRRGAPPEADTEARLGRARRQATAQLAADMALLAGVLHLSGGVENPLFVYFVVHVTVAGILLPRRGALGVATFAVVLFGAVSAGEYGGLLAHYPLWGGQVQLYANAPFVVTLLAVFTTTVYLAVYLSGDIVNKLRARDRELMSMATSLERGTLDLQEAYQKIKTLEQKKSDVLRVASHQLRSPLSAIKSLLDVLLHGYARDEQERLNLLERAHERTDGMLVMIDELLILSRLKDADHLPERSAETLDVCSLMADLDLLYRPRAREKGVTLDLSPPPRTCLITAAGADIREALNNLVDNAINYTPRGGRVSCSAIIEADKLIVKVADTGIGIDENEKERVFNEFYRAPNAKAVDPSGTGLGLAIVKRAVEKWNGTIMLDSTPGNGTTFTLRFPLVA